MLLVLVLAVLGLAASPATAAAPVPGATYTGTTSEYSSGADPWNPAWDSTAQFTVSADGSSITSVLLRYIKDWHADGTYHGYWAQVGGGSAPIVDGAFQVPLAAGGSADYSGSYFKGSFTGTQAASGTLYVRESHQETTGWPRFITVTVTTASHVLTWTATSASAPQLTNVTQSVTSWRLGSELPKLARAGPPVGTTFAFTLKQPARVWFFFSYRTIGRLVGGKCLAQTNANRGKARCLRTVRAAFSRQANAGRTRLRFQGRLDRRRKLPPGLYRVIIGATANGRWSKPAILRFTILR